MALRALEQKEENDVQSTAGEDWGSFTPARMEELIKHADSAPEIGYLVWTKVSHGEETIKENIRALKARGIRHLRTGLSWAEWFHPETRPWITWYLQEYAKHFTVVPCLTFTPPELALMPRVNAPPKNIRYFGGFVRDAIGACGSCFDTVELGNEWNLNTDWDPSLDPEYEIFTAMIHEGAAVARQMGKRVLLGGPSKVNKETLAALSQFHERGLGTAIDVLGFHNLRGTWSDHTPSPPLGVQAAFLRKAWGIWMPIWLTEYGFPVADPEGRFALPYLEAIQTAVFAYGVYACLAGKIERLYWYTYKDEVHQSLRFATTGWEDVLQFSFGDTEENGRMRLLGRLLCEGGPLHVLRYAVREGIMPLVEKASLGRKMVA